MSDKNNNNSCHLGFFEFSTDSGVVCRNSLVFILTLVSSTLALLVLVLLITLCCQKKRQKQNENSDFVKLTNSTGSSSTTPSSSNSSLWVNTEVAEIYKNKPMDKIPRPILKDQVNKF